MMFSSQSSASLINTDFAGGFNGWEGQVNTFDTVTDVESFFEPVVNFDDFNNSFNLLSNGVELVTAFNGDLDTFGVFLFQSFVVSSNAVLLSLEFLASADFFTVTLVDENLNLIHDFTTDGLGADLSALRGRQLSLEFGVEDTDFAPGDSLMVSNISLTSSPLAVPAPSSLLLMLVALFGLRIFLPKRQM